MTEFGRTARENGLGGTDHGHGSCLFVLGNGWRVGRCTAGCRRSTGTRSTRAAICR
jgi:uncharacterized protein (DUF1501 family)